MSTSGLTTFNPTTKFAYALKHSGYTKGYRVEEVEYGN